MIGIAIAVRAAFGGSGPTRPVVAAIAPRPRSSNDGAAWNRSTPLAQATTSQPGSLPASVATLGSPGAVSWRSAVYTWPSAVSTRGTTIG